MRKAIVAFFSLCVLAFALLTLVVFLFRHPTPDPFQQARADLPPHLPGDAGAHFASQTEWWYYTGELRGEGGERFGFELVFFKAYAPSHALILGRIPVSWLCNPVYSAHLAIVDLGRGTFHYEEIANFPFPWTGGARTDRFEVWIQGWRAVAEGEKHHLRATASTHALELALVSQKLPVFHGGQGAVNMGGGGTSYYYSFTRLVGRGWVEVEGRRLPVQGQAWMDHQWGSWDWAQFEGWDWFSLRLESGEELMFFQFRDKDGKSQAESFGTYVAADGMATHLPFNSFRIQVLDQWRSPVTGAVYPSGWDIVTTLPPGRFKVRPLLADQELPLRMGPTYWEGISQVTGTLAGSVVAGTAYVEMTGYR